MHCYQEQKVGWRQKKKVMFPRGRHRRQQSLKRTGVHIQPSTGKNIIRY